MDTHSSPARTVAQSAPFGFRLLAMIYDSLPVIAVWFAAAAVALALRAGAPATPGSIAAWGTFGLMQLAGFAYFGLSWRRGGQTLGMRAWRLRLVNADGSAPPGWGALALRYVVAGLSLGALGLGFFWSLWDREHRSWHDLASGTVLVRLPRPDRKSVKAAS